MRQRGLSTLPRIEESEIGDSMNFPLREFA